MIFLFLKLIIILHVIVDFNIFFFTAEIVISGGMSIPKILTIVDAHAKFAPRKATYASKV